MTTKPKDDVYTCLGLALALALGAAAGCSKGQDAQGTEPSARGPASTEADDQGAKPMAAPSGQIDDEQLEKLQEEAKAMTDAFQAKLKQRLMTAMQEGGPGAAIQVCKVEAPGIAATVPAKQGKAAWHIGRTALKVRNPDNAPTSWQRTQLEAFAAKAESAPSADIASLEWSEVAHAGGESEWRYMRAIPTGGLCLTCHGDKASLPPPVKAKLAELYPKDEATGFEAGQLRGAFVVTVPL